MNFESIGARTAIKSNAFAQIRRASKTYTTDLVHTPSVFLAKYKQINALFENENKYAESLNYGLKRQHNLTASAATASNNANFLDRAGMEAFLDHTAKFSVDTHKTEGFDRDLNAGLPFEQSSSTVQDTNQPSMAPALRRSEANFVNTLSNNDGLEKMGEETMNTLVTSMPQSDVNDLQGLVSRPTSSNKQLQIALDDEQLLMGERTVHHVVSEGLVDEPLHTTGQTSKRRSNMYSLAYSSAGEDLLNQTKFSQIKHQDETALLALSTNRLLRSGPNKPIIGNDPNLAPRYFDGHHRSSTSIESTGTKFTSSTSNKFVEDVDILK
jgi:hypothetical protein